MDEPRQLQGLPEARALQAPARAKRRQLNPRVHLLRGPLQRLIECPTSVCQDILVDTVHDGLLVHSLRVHIRDGKVILASFL